MKPWFLLPALALGSRGFQAQAPVLEPARGEQAPLLTSRWTSEVYRLRSEATNQTLRLFVAKPPSFARSERSLPVLYLLDGQHTFGEVLSALAALTDSGQVPEMLLVGIESLDRRADFTPAEIDLPDVGARARAGSTLDFLEHELVPAVEAELRGGRPRVLLGHSHAGMLVLHAVPGARSASPGSWPWTRRHITPTAPSPTISCEPWGRKSGPRCASCPPRSCSGGRTSSGRACRRPPVRTIG